MENLFAISPIDGRYADKIEGLNILCSEFGFLRLRLQIEVEWLISLGKETKLHNLPAFDAAAEKFLRDLYLNFTLADAQHIKEIERTLKHDVKSIEYFLREKLQENPRFKPYLELIHFTCTSEDINNLAYALMLKELRAQYLLPMMQSLTEKLVQLSKEYAKIPLLARTHGQPATPTTVGKEFANFAIRLNRQFKQLKKNDLLGKFNGTVGNFNAAVIACPEIDWVAFNKQFIESFGLTCNLYTTQIEPHDYIAELCGVLMRFNNILLMLARDVWAYIALNYFTQKSEKQEIGSSVMPHKINPIDFENAEGNLGIANALFDHFANKLPISRWQRDLSDSTVMRNLGVAAAHSLVAYHALNSGLCKIAINHEQLAADLSEHFEVLAEAIQTTMRRYGIANAYEDLKQLSRGKKVSEKLLHDFIKASTLPDAIKAQLLQLNPCNYLGKAADLAAAIDKYL